MPEFNLPQSREQTKAICPECGERSVVVSVLNADKRMTCIECWWNSVKD